MAPKAAKQDVQPRLDPASAAAEQRFNAHAQTRWRYDKSTFEALPTDFSGDESQNDQHWFPANAAHEKAMRERKYHEMHASTSRARALQDEMRDAAKDPPVQDIKKRLAGVDTSRPEPLLLRRLSSFNLAGKLPIYHWLDEANLPLRQPARFLALQVKHLNLFYLLKNLTSS